MSKTILQPKVTNRYKESGPTLTKVVQEWINEKYFFGNLDKNEIERNPE